MTAMNMGYQGDQRLVTSNAEAIILLNCNTPIQACSNCFKVQGPTVNQLQLLEDSQQDRAQSLFYVYLSWPNDYLGNMSVSVDQQRCGKYLVFPFDGISSCCLLGSDA